MVHSSDNPGESTSARQRTRLPGWPGLAALGLGLLVLLPAVCRAGRDAQDLPPEQAFQRAEEKYRADKVVEAEPFYRQALKSENAFQRRRSYDQLLIVYARLVRPDRAIDIGLAYREYLQRLGEQGRLRVLLVELGEFYRVLGHYRACESYLTEALAPTEGQPPLPEGPRLTALLGLAAATEKQADLVKAGRCWQQVEEFVRGRLADARKPPAPREQIELGWALAANYHFRKQYDRAVAALEGLLPKQDQLNDPAGKCKTLRLLALEQAARGNDDGAEQRLRQALELITTAEPNNHMLEGDLAAELFQLLERKKKPVEANQMRDQAAAHYQDVLQTRAGHRPGKGGPLEAFWKLLQLYQDSSQYRKSLQLFEDQSEPWVGSPVLAPKLKSEKGYSQVILGAYAQAHGLLRDAVANLETQKPLNLIELPRALNNLALVEQAVGQLDRAEALSRQCLDLYRQQEIPQDLVLAETYNLLGTCTALRGEYAQAIDIYNEGVAVCEKLGPVADRSHSDLLLNKALLYKSQGYLDEALRTCEVVREIFQRRARNDILVLSAIDASRAGMLVSLGRLPEADLLVESVLEGCRRLHITNGPILTNVLHYRGLYYLQQRRLDQAEELWQRVRGLQEQEKQTLLLPRTFNSLGLTAELRGRDQDAEKLYRQAQALQNSVPRSYPATRFITLWRLANVADRQGRAAEARQLLEQAIDVVETARMKTYGDAQQRSAYFSQFAPGFDQLVQWAVRDGETVAAFRAAVRGRSRTLLDQLRLTGVDPRDSLRGAAGDQLKSRDEQLRQRLNVLRGQAQLISLDEVDSEPVKKLLAEYDNLQQTQASVWREIINASPVYRQLAAEDPSQHALAALRERILGPKTLLLLYYCGRDGAYLMLIGSGSDKPEVFPLSISADLAGRLTVPEPPTLSQVLTTSRGIRVRPRLPEIVPPPQPPSESSGGLVPLNQETARAVVDYYLGVISDPEFNPTRGLKVVPRDPMKPLPVQRLELAAHVFLPPEARRRIRSLNPTTLLVVPDGPLHKLPLEALLVQEGERPRYLLDELPPIVYAPSVPVLLLLADRKPASAGQLSLLTVANPAYPQDKPKAQPVSHASRSATATAIGLRGQLPLLENTATESARIRGYFAADQVKALVGPAATEKAVAAAVAGKRFVHIAAHGFADDRFGNLFGALALTPPPPGKETAEEDGFLSLHEIYTLPLQDCELAVLSACMTNVGPQRPLEAGVTLATGFLAAGAHHVVASHWSVDDESTAQLMAAFFQGVTTAARKGEKPHYARALQQARLNVRNQPKWSAPFYWAPFVLLGPDD